MIASDITTQPKSANKQPIYSQLSMFSANLTDLKIVNISKCAACETVRWLNVDGHNVAWNYIVCHLRHNIINVDTNVTLRLRRTVL
jgi:hypothetical protein